MKAISFFLAMLFMFVSFGAYAASDKCHVNVLQLPTDPSSYKSDIYFHVAETGKQVATYKPNSSGTQSFYVPCGTHVIASFGPLSSSSKAPGSAADWYLYKACINSAMRITWYGKDQSNWIGNGQVIDGAKCASSGSNKGILGDI